MEENKGESLVWNNRTMKQNPLKTRLHNFLIEPMYFFFNRKHTCKSDVKYLWISWYFVKFWKIFWGTLEVNVNQLNWWEFLNRTLTFHVCWKTRLRLTIQETISKRTYTIIFPQTELRPAGLYLSRSSSTLSLWRQT